MFIRLFLRLDVLLLIQQQKCCNTCHVPDTIVFWCLDSGSKHYRGVWNAGTPTSLTAEPIESNKNTPT